MKKRGMKWAARGMALLLTCAMVLGGVILLPREVPADSIIGAEPTEGSLTINKKGTAADKPLDGAAFSIYKVMSLTPGTNPGEYAEYAVEEAFADALDGVTPDELGNYSATEMENKINALKEAAEATTATASGTTVGGGAYTFSKLPLGYYLVVETAAPAGYVAGSPFLIAVPSTDNYNNPSAPGENWVYEVTAEPKNAQVSIEKELGEIDGSVKVGDYVDYKVTTTIPNYPDAYFENEVTFVLSDTMSDGLEIQNDATHPVTVKVDKTAVSPSETTYELEAVPATGNTPDLKLAFVKDYIKANRGKSVEVTYYAKITDQAVMGNIGNPNKVTLSYNNNPGETADAGAPEVKVYSFGIEVIKFAKEGGEDEGLDGAEFTLYSDKAMQTVVGTGISGTDGIKGKLNFPRLDEGTYYLKETKSPAGYTLLANPIKVEITAVKDTAGHATGAFTLKVNDEDITAKTGDFVTKHDQATGTATVAVENHKGFTLPATGGMGIAIFLIIGAAGIIVISVMMNRKTKKKS